MSRVRFSAAKIDPGSPGALHENSSPHATQSGDSYLDRLVRYYRHYAHELVGTAPMTLQAYEGREESLFQALQKKYGPESSVPKLETLVQQDLMQSRRRKNQSGVDTSHLSSSSCSSDDDTQPPLTFPNFPPVHFDLVRLRLERFYELYAPDRIDNVPATLASFEGRSEVMFRVIEKKYGPEPRAFIVIPRPSFTSVRSSSDSRSLSFGQVGGKVGERIVATSLLVGPGAGPDPRTLLFHAPYSYESALAAAGVRPEFVSQVLSSYGDGRQPYAAAVALLLYLITNPGISDGGGGNSAASMDILFEGDANTDIPFPFHRLAALKGCNPDGLDQFAFTHIIRVRAMFLTTVQHIMHTRELEALQRKRLYRQHLKRRNALQRHIKLVSLALVMLEPIETERRDGIALDQRLRFEGLFTWFRQRKLEILRGVPLVPKLYRSRSIDDDDDDEVETNPMPSDRKTSRTPSRSLLSPNQISAVGSRSGSRFDAAQEKLNRDREASLRVCEETVGKWSATPTLESRNSSRDRSRTPSHAVSGRTPSGMQRVAAAERSCSDHSNAGQHRGPVGVWLPSGTSVATHHARSHTPNPRSGVETGICDGSLASPLVAPEPKIVVVREIVHSNPFRNISPSRCAPFASASTAAPLTAAPLYELQSSIAKRASTSITPSVSTQTSVASPPPYASLARVREQQGVVPCSSERFARLKAIVPQGTFSNPRLTVTDR